MQRSADSYIRYSGMALQIAAIVLVFAFGGVLLDRRVPWKIPVFTLVLSVLGIFLALYSSLREFINKDKNHEDKNI
ncbi:MAG: AtpZ/AtpI family protein [Bacteroidales bacterium]|nr:AtpZ/AtpI family protein [Bacteroidales bacterium]